MDISTISTWGLHARVFQRTIPTSAGCMLSLWCLEHEIACSIEQPAGSWLWKQPPWLGIKPAPQVNALSLDRCSFGTRWRKRTALWYVHCALSSRKRTCTRDHKHLILRGRTKGRVPRTKKAEAYPRRLGFSWARVLSQS